MFVRLKNYVLFLEVFATKVHSFPSPFESRRSSTFNFAPETGPCFYKKRQRPAALNRSDPCVSRSRPLTSRRALKTRTALAMLDCRVTMRRQVFREKIPVLCVIENGENHLSTTIVYSRRGLSGV